MRSKTYPLENSNAISIHYPSTWNGPIIVFGWYKESNTSIRQEFPSCKEFVTGDFEIPYGCILNPHEIRVAVALAVRWYTFETLIQGMHNVWLSI